MRTLFLIRHGIARPRGNYSRDADRPLSDDGIARTTECARGFAKVAEPKLILASPLLRARQTAELFSQAFRPPPNITLLDELAGVNDAAALLRLVNAEPGDAVALVGHEPDMSGLTGLLIGPGDGARVEFKRAAAARIDFQSLIRPGGGTLIWLLPPKVLQALAACDSPL